MLRARCVPLQYLSNATHGVKVRSNQTDIVKTSVTTHTQEDVVLPHLTHKEAWQRKTKQINESLENSCDQMIIKSTNMDYEQCQDLSDLAWFEKRAQPWGAAEMTGVVNPTTHTEQLNPELVYESSADYNLTDFDPFYTISRSDSMEELKRVAPPMEVAPMLHCNTMPTLPMSNIIKTEYNDDDDDKVIDKDGDAEQKLDSNFLKMDPDMLLLDTPDLLSELGGCDLIDYIISEGSIRCDEPSPTVDLPIATASREMATKATTSSETRLPYLSQPNQFSPQQITPPDSPPPFKKIKKSSPMKETYLAIPRELTSGSTEDKKIPKMLILKTPSTSTINLQDLGISIAERIKTIGKRPRPKRFSETVDDDDDDEDYKYESEDDNKKRKSNKRARRLSSSSSTSLSDRYRELRDKNNEASRKSRQNRKEKEKDLSTTLELAERENMKLRARSDELEKLVHSLRKLLLQIVINKGSSR